MSARPERSHAEEHDERGVVRMNIEMTEDQTRLISEGRVSLSVSEFGWVHALTADGHLGTAETPRRAIELLQL